MKELNSFEVKQVRGGILPALVYVAGQGLAIYNTYRLAKKIGGY